MTFGQMAEIGAFSSFERVSVENICPPVRDRQSRHERRGTEIVSGPSAGTKR
jgi:hypothetical protein